MSCGHYELTRYPQPTTESASEPLRDFVPVHNAPPRFEIFGARVFVGQIIGVLPDIIAQNGRHSRRKRAVLIGRRDHFQGARCVFDQPCPARTELFGTGVVDRRFERVERAESRINRLF